MGSVRAAWKGYLELGFVSCGVKVIGATTEASKIHFKILNRKNKLPVRALVIAMAVLVSACGESDPPVAGSQPQDQLPPAQTDTIDKAPTQDADPTPQTGSGGEQQPSEPAQPKPN